MRKLVAALACRNTGSRLFGKPLHNLDIDKKITILDHLIILLKNFDCIGEIVLAISKGSANKIFIDYAKKYNLSYIIGDERDVLSRLIQCGEKSNATDIFRITTESPFPWYESINDAWQSHIKNNMDATFLGLLPDGCTHEIITLAALKKSHLQGEERHRSELCTLYIRENTDQFKIQILEVPKELQRLDLRLTVDYPEDLVVCRNVYMYLRDSAPFISIRDIITYLDTQPTLVELIAPFCDEKPQNKTTHEVIKMEKNTEKIRNSIEPITLSIKKSEELWERGKQLIPCGTQTASKGPDQFVNGIYPKYIQSGKGSHVFDVDGNEFIDYPCSLGVNILGHSYPLIVEAIRKQAIEGINFSLMHPLEVIVAKKIIDAIPCAESVRFLKNGSDVTTAAVRIARAHTGREKIAHCGYHGWQDWFVITTGKTKGIPKVLESHIQKFKYNDIDSLKKIFQENPGEIAAVIMEPVVTEEPTDDFLNKVKDLASQNGAVLIFDEMVTGFRFGLGGAQKYFDVIPDLACFGKCVANGMPLSIVTGKKEIMDQCHEIFLSATFGGEAVSLAAASATIKELQEKNVVKHIWEVGRKFKEEFNAVAREINVDIRSIGYPPRQNLIYKDVGGYSSTEIKTLFLQETIKRGILIGNVIFFTYSHTNEDIEKTINACKEALKIIREGINQNNLRERIKGSITGEVFRKKSE